MNTILSILLCIAMLFSGTSGMNASPETATTWSVRNLTLTLGSESVTLTPSVSLTAAAGSDRATLHFEAANNGSTILPIALDATSDELRFSLGNNSRAYRMSASELEELLDLAFYGDMEDMELATNLIYTYGMFLASVLHDSEGLQQREEAVGQLLFDRCATPAGDTTVEVDGNTYPAKKYRLHFDIGIIDALRDCGWPELEALLNGALNMLNEATGITFGSFEEFYTTLMNESGMSTPPAMPELSLIVAETDDFTYYGYDGLDLESQISPNFTLKTNRCESIVRADGATANIDMTLSADGLALQFILTEEQTGDSKDPDTTDLDIQPLLIDDGEQMGLSVTYDSAKDAEGKRSGALRLKLPTELTRMGMPVDQVALEFAPVAEDGATTISLSAAKGDQTIFGLSLEVLRTDAALEDYFSGAQIYDITTEALDSDEMSPLAMALMSDLSQLSLDAMQLAQDSSVQAMGSMLQRADELLSAAIYNTAQDTYADYGDSYDDYGDSYDDYGDYDGYGDSYDPTAQTEGDYQAALPDYTPPAGYALTNTAADSSTVTLTYENEAEGKRFMLSVDQQYSTYSQSYICADGGAEALTAPIAETYPLDDGTFYTVYVTMPSGQTLTFSFDEAIDDAALSTYLGGLSQ